jgi:hypothetical protein
VNVHSVNIHLNAIALYQKPFSPHFIMEPNQKPTSRTLARKFIVSTLTFNRAIIVLLFISQAMFCMAKHVTRDNALNIAQKFYQKRLSSLGPVAAKRIHARSVTRFDFKLNYIRTVVTPTVKTSAATTSSTTTTSDSTAYYYVYNVGSSQGFVIVSGDDVVKPVLGYALQGSFSTTNIPPNVQGWLDLYKKEIQYAMKAEASTASLNAATTSTTSNTSTQLTDSVAPLLGDILWDQDTPYNLFCPYNKTYKEYTETGCVATAMAQIMKYYQWPAKGIGSESYKSGTYGTQSVNFGAETYDWADMQNSYGATTTGKQDTVVATLMYACGVAVKMQYDIAENGGSAASVSDAGTALINNFGYDAGLQSYDRSLFTESQWESLIQTELNASRPVLYSGDTNVDGHAFVCDGYDSSDLYHINWGWSGLFNGYFQLSALNPDWPGSGGETGGFSQYQQILTGIQKPTVASHVSYELGTYNQGLTSSVSSLSSISTQTLSINFGFINYALNNYTGNVGVGLYKNGVYQKTLSSASISALQPYNYYPSYPFSNISLSGLSAGNYQIYAIYEPSDSTSWSIMKQSTGFNNYLNVTISGTTATIQAPETSPVLTLSQPVQVSENAYQNKTGVFTVNITNSGTEFYSFLGLYIYSKTNATLHQYVDTDVVCIPAGATQTVVFSGTLTTAPGAYYATVLADSTNSYSDKSYKEIGPVADNAVSFNILSTPSSPKLTLNSALAFANGGTSTVYNNQEITLTANITNKGGYFDSTLVAFVFPSKGGTSLTTLDPKTIYLDSLGTQTVTLRGSIDLDPGEYFFGLFYYAGGWVECTPYGSAQLDFSLDDTNTAVPVVTTSGWRIYPNPVTDMLYMNGLNDETATVTVFDVSGKMVMSQQLTNNMIDVSSLAKGIYILRVTTADSVHTNRFVKE